MVEPQELKLIGARHHKVGCMCRMCTRVREMWAKGEEKRQKGLRVRKSSRNIKRQGFVQAYTDPNRPDTFGKPGNAALAVGYAEETGNYLLSQPQVRDGVRAALERAGITGEYRAEKLKEGMEAMETRFFQHEGEVKETHEVIDFYARHKYLETAMRAAGDFPKDEPVQQAALIVNVGDAALDDTEWSARLEAIEAGQDVCQFCKAEHPSTYDCRKE